MQMLLDPIIKQLPEPTLRTSAALSQAQESDQSCESSSSCSCRCQIGAADHVCFSLEPHQDSCWSPGQTALHPWRRCSRNTRSPCGIITQKELLATHSTRWACILLTSVMGQRVNGQFRCGGSHGFGWLDFKLFATS